jgi:hypothetical protein
MMLRFLQITSIEFTDTFSHSLVCITDRVKNPPDLSVETFVTQRLTSHRYACGLAASAGHADATLRFLQAIEPTHCFSLVGEPMKVRSNV